MHAYDEVYLEGAMKAMGDMMDYAVRGLGFSPDLFYRLFLASEVADAMGSGHPKYVAGMSGYELAIRVLTEVSDIEPDRSVELPEDPGDVFWAGWVLAWFQWYTAYSFSYFETHGLDIQTVLSLYAPLHEADLTKVLEVGTQRMQDWAVTNGSSLRRYRKGAGLTQQELAERAGVSLRMVRAYEQGTQDIAKAEVASIQRLSQALHCQVSDLVDG